MTDVMSRVHDHLDESLQRFDESRIVGIFLQGYFQCGFSVH